MQFTADSETEREDLERKANFPVRMMSPKGSVLGENLANDQILCSCVPSTVRGYYTHLVLSSMKATFSFSELLIFFV